MLVVVVVVEAHEEGCWKKAYEGKVKIYHFNLAVLRLVIFWYFSLVFIYCLFFGIFLYSLIESFVGFLLLSCLSFTAHSVAGPSFKHSISRMFRKQMTDSISKNGNQVTCPTVETQVMPTSLLRMPLAQRQKLTIPYNGIKKSFGHYWINILLHSAGVRREKCNNNKIT